MATKKCKFCCSEIDKKAKICPHCQKKQSGLDDVSKKAIKAFLFIFIGIPFIIGFFRGLTGGSSKKTDDKSVADLVEDSITPKATEYTEETQITTEAVNETTTEDITHRSGDDIIGVSDKILSNDRVNVSCEDSIRNDNTGKWRLARISDSIYIENYALDYYKNYFKSDDEIHAVINFTTNTTAKISCFDGILNVTTYKYIDKEEHDANLLFSGDKISEFLIYIDNGDIERIS